MILWYNFTFFLHFSNMSKCIKFSKVTFSIRFILIMHFYFISKLLFIPSYITKNNTYCSRYIIKCPGTNSIFRYIFSCFRIHIHKFTEVLVWVLVTDNITDIRSGNNIIHISITQLMPNLFILRIFQPGLLLINYHAFSI